MRHCLPLLADQASRCLHISGQMHSHVHNHMHRVPPALHRPALLLCAARLAPFVWITPQLLSVCLPPCVMRGLLLACQPPSMHGPQLTCCMRDMGSPAAHAQVSLLPDASGMQGRFILLVSGATAEQVQVAESLFSRLLQQGGAWN